MKKILTTEFLMTSFQRIQNVVNSSPNPLSKKSILEKLDMKGSTFRLIIEKGKTAGMARKKVGKKYDEIRYSNVDFAQTQKVKR